MILIDDGQTLRVHVEFCSFDELEPEISWIKGGQEIQTGGAPSGQSGGHLSPGGECFAPFVNHCCDDHQNVPVFQ